MAALVLLAALVWPNVAGRRERAQLDYVGSQVASLLSLARSAAMSTGRRHRCAFTEGGAKLRVESEADPLDRPEDFQPLKAEWGQLNLADENVRCVLVDLMGLDKVIRTRERDFLDRELPAQLFEPIMFGPDGRCDSAVILLSGPSPRALRLELNGLTGQVRIQEQWDVEAKSE